MTKWSVGTLKVRGTVKNLKRFCLKGLKPVDDWCRYTTPLFIDDRGILDSDLSCHIDGTNRGFVKKPHVDFYKYMGKDEDIIILCFDALFAWHIEAWQLAKVSHKYDVDIKIYSFNGGDKYNQDIEIIKGEVVKDIPVTYEDYQWDCVCPNLGG